MKRFFLVFLLIFSSISFADNSKCWGMGKDDKTRPDIICRQLIEEFLFSLRNMPKEEALKKIGSPGVTGEKGSGFEDRHHYLSNSDKYDGDLNITFKDNTVAIIEASVSPEDSSDDNYHFIWNGYLNYFCSDFPGDHPKCNGS